MIRILLVEDDLTLARTLERLIRRTLDVAHEIVHRTTAEQAITCLRLAGDDQYALVISDCRLAGQLTGLDILPVAQLFGVRFLFVSSDERCGGRGVPWLQKPASPAAIRAAVLVAIDPPKTVIDIPFDDISEVACG